MLTDKAATWWIEIKSEINKRSQAIDAIRCAFAPRKQPHEMYLEVFAKKQGNENIDDFVCGNRALLAQFPVKRQKEEEHLEEHRRHSVWVVENIVQEGDSSQ